MTLQERIDLVRDAQAMLRDAVDLLEEAFAADDWAQNCLLAPIKAVVGQGDPLVLEPTLSEYIERLEAL
jgi:hypothetical protein